MNNLLNNQSDENFKTKFCNFSVGDFVTFIKDDGQKGTKNIIKHNDLEQIDDNSDKTGGSTGKKKSESIDINELYGCITSFDLMRKNLQSVSIQVQILAKSHHLFNGLDVSSKELIRTHNSIVVNQSRIKSKIRVLSDVDFCQDPDKDEWTFFQRSSLQIINREEILEPSLNCIAKVCFCKSLFNPSEIYVKCEFCNSIIHCCCAENSDLNSKIVIDKNFKRKEEIVTKYKCLNNAQCLKRKRDEI